MVEQEIRVNSLPLLLELWFLLQGNVKVELYSFETEEGAEKTSLFCEYYCCESVF